MKTASEFREWWPAYGWHTPDWIPPPYSGARRHYGSGHAAVKATVQHLNELQRSQQLPSSYLSDADYLVFQTRFSPEGQQHILKFSVLAKSTQAAAERALEYYGALADGWRMGDMYIIPSVYAARVEVREASRYLVTDIGSV